MSIPRARRMSGRPLAIGGVVLVVGMVLLGAVSTFYTEVLWFNEVGYSDVFWTSFSTRMILGAVFGIVFAGLMLLNLWIVRKITSPTRLFTVPDPVFERYRATLLPYTKWVVITLSAMFGLFAGSGASVKWREFLLFRNSVPFGQPDPIFHQDLGFYVFKLPFHQFLFAWGFSTLIIVTLVAAAAHYFMGGIRPQARGERVAPEVRAHLSVLLGLLVLLKAWGYRLDQFNLLFSARGQVDGASYTDVNAQLPALRLLVIIAIVCAALFLVNARYKNWLFPIGGVGLLAVTSVIAGGIYPAAIQRLRVTPNERLLERPFIERNITATRAAYGIDAAEERPLGATADLSAQDIKDSRATVENIRLWDPFVLKQTYDSLQRVKQYYEFLDVDVDRYEIGGQRRQVMLSAREIDLAGLDSQARTWLNTHLVYTHGYGVAASRVDRVTVEGQPSFVLLDVPTRGVEGAPKVTQARLYFGERGEAPFVVVNSKQKELDFPQGDRFAETSYAGKGGIKLTGVLRRAAFAWRFKDVNLLISGAITPESRLMMRRTVRERVEAAAPFLKVDFDPYITIADGRLVWILDAYTTTRMYPYSERSNLSDLSRLTGSANYIRNSVKVVVDAEHGTVDLYAWDEVDPVLRAWRKIFPDVVKPRAAIPAPVLQHVRYPEDLFKIQTGMYENYHITDPDNFYSKEDAWLVSGDPTSTQQGSTLVPPYYVLMNLPGEKDLDFVLVRPFTPNGRDNLTAYMVAHGDLDQYGKLVVYVLPKGLTVFGPKQVQTRINADPVIKPFITLNDAAGARVIRGNLLIIPIKDSLLYVQPLYVLGQGSTLPELRRVVVVAGDKVKMGATLAEALALIFGEQTPDKPEPGAPSASVAALIQQAIDHDRAAEACLRTGDFACFGRERQLQREAIQRAAAASGAPAASPSPTAGG